MKRNRRLEVRLSDEEFAKLAYLAKERHCSLSRATRYLILFLPELLGYSQEENSN